MNRKNVRLLRSVGLVATSLLASCSSSQVGTLPTVTQENTSQYTLQLAAGTATIALDNTGNSYAGLNFVATFRKAAGLSATTANTPILSGPPGFKQIRGLSPSELLAADAAYQANPSNAPVGPGTPLGLVSTSKFNTTVGVYAYGFAPLNLAPNQQDYDVYQLAPQKNAVYFNTLPTSCTDFGPVGGSSTAYPQGQWDSVRFAALLLPFPTGNGQCGNPPAKGTALNGFQYFGGPPAWPSPQGYGMPTGFRGYPAGFMDVYQAPVAGTYTLDVAIPSDPGLSQYTHFTASAQLPASAVSKPLPLFPPPVVRPQGDGSAYIDINVPKGVTEAIVFLVNDRCDNGEQSGLPAATYSLVTHQTGQQTLFLSSALGPPGVTTGNPTHTLCTATDPVGNPQYTAIAAGFDYPAYEAAPPFNTSLTPAITNGDGHSGTADVTTSIVVTGKDVASGS